MVSLFYARRYPAGREVKPDGQPVPNDTPGSDANAPSSMSVNDLQPSGVPPADGVPAPSDDSSPTPTATIAPSPDVSVTTDIPAQPSNVPDHSPQPSDLPPPATSTPVQNPPPGSIPSPSPTPSPPPEQSASNASDIAFPPASSDLLNSSTFEYVPQPTHTDYFVPSSALNNPQPTQTLGTDTTPPSSIIVSTQVLPASSTVTSLTSTLQPSSTAVLAGGSALSTSSSSNKKYIIGGAVGGGVLVLILLALFLFCCRKRRVKRDPELSGGGHSDGQPGYGQFACCNHGNCKSNGQPQIEQKAPLKPFVLKSDSAALTPKEGQQQRAVSLNRRDSTESLKSAGSDTSVGSAYSSDFGGSQYSRRSQKRPPPLKLTSLVTPVIHGPQNNPRQGVDRSSLRNSREVPAIAVEPLQSGTPDGMGSH